MDTKRQILLSQVKLQSAGKKMGQGMFDTSKKSSKNEVFYPSLYLSANQLDTTGYKVGDTIKIVAEAVIRSKESRVKSDGKTCETCDLELRKIGVVN